MVPVWAWVVVLLVVAIAIYLFSKRSSHSQGKPCTSQKDCGYGNDLYCAMATGATKGYCKHSGSPPI